jgi:hypothetical protein
MSGRHALDAATAATEATRYLEVVGFFRSLGTNVRWLPEAEEIEPRRLGGQGRLPTCELCAGPLVRINGRHVCLAQ